MLTISEADTKLPLNNILSRSVKIGVVTHSILIRDGPTAPLAVALYKEARATKHVSQVTRGILAAQSGTYLRVCHSAYVCEEPCVLPIK